MSFKMICFDMDGVLFKDINFWLELHKRFGTYERGKLLTEKYLHEDYKKLVEEVVVKLWKGLDAGPYHELVNSIEYLPGVKDTFRHIKDKGYVTAIISASSIDVARRAQKDLGVDHIFANELETKDGKITGKFFWPIGAGNHLKAQIITRLCKKVRIKPVECIYVGDSDTDLEAFKIVGMSIAFNSKSSKLKAAATHVVDTDDLSDIMIYV